MLNNKKLAIVLFSSLGLNIFLGGVVGARLLHKEPPPPPPVAEEKPRAKKANAKKANTNKKPHKGAKALRDEARKSMQTQKKGPPPRGHASPDLMLLRHMVRIMGGPEDPRIKELRDARKEEIMKMRREMRGAHERVHQALSANKLEESELQEALKNLRKTTFSAQAKAQEGIVLLASLMTEEERKRLKESKPPGPPGPGERRAGPAPGKAP